MCMLVSRSAPHVLQAGLEYLGLLGISLLSLAKVGRMLLASLSQNVVRPGCFLLLSALLSLGNEGIVRVLGLVSLCSNLLGLDSMRLSCICIASMDGCKY